MTLLHLFRLRRTLRSLGGIEKQLVRIADALEANLNAQGIVVNPEKPEPAEVSYSNESADREKEALAHALDSMGLQSEEQLEELLKELKEQNAN